MKLIIDIQEDRYRQIKDLPNAFNSDICKAIRNGIPYDGRPKGELIQSLTELCNEYCKNCPITDVPNECTDCICTHIRGIIKGGAV